MYIPKHYQGKENEEAVAFMRRFNFAPLISSLNNVPLATHLPFVIHEEAGNLILRSHFAKANQHWQHIQSHENLVIFTEPHAYISPTHYDKQENVPTWNYLSIHAYGKATLLTDPTQVFQLLEWMMEDFEPAYKQQWDSLSADYRSKMAKGIVAFEIQVERLESKAKLSQNKKANERKSIIDTLASSPESSERTIAEYMQRNESDTD